MSGFVATWERAAGGGTGQQAEVDLICFSTGPLASDVRLEVGRFGVPSKEAYAQVQVRRILRDDQSAWFDRWRSGAVRTVAALDLGAGIDALDEADTCHVVRVRADDPEDLGYLQAAWAVARFLVARGASCVLDVYAGRFHAGEAVGAVPADAAFELDREITLVSENDEVAPGSGHLLHTRGMLKFGRPDVVAVVGQGDEPLVAEVLRQIAAGMAQGWTPPERHGIELADDLTIYLTPYTPGEALPDVHLNNRGLLLVDEQGGDLQGLAARMPRPDPPPEA